MIRHFCLIVLVFGYCAGSFARFDRISECERICAVGMSAECCECIGCHQAMRFGKRAFQSASSLGSWNRPTYSQEKIKRVVNAANLLELLSDYSILVPREDE